MAIDETYFRKYLDDPLAISVGTPQQPPSNGPAENNDTTYFRKWLDDPSN